MDRPETRYAWNGEISLAYQVVGDGPVDLIYMQGLLSNVDVNWEQPALAGFLRELGRFSRLVVTDRRGLGCSERFTPADTPPVEILMEDVLAVLDAVGFERPVIFATGDCGLIASLFAATHVTRLSALVLYNVLPSFKESDDAPWGWVDERFSEVMSRYRRAWGDGSWAYEANPSLAVDERGRAWAARYERASVAPGAVYSEAMRFLETDIRGVLPSIHVPTLVLHRTGDWQDIEGGRYLASQIRSATFTELPGTDHFPWLGDQEGVLRAVERFVGAVREEEAELDRMLATILFTDIVGSTPLAARLGDHDWRDLVGHHHSTVRALLGRYRGREIDTAGDGFFASFDGPARAVRCAQAVVEAVRPLGLEVRAGLHTGEVEAIGDKVGGIAVSIGARIGGMAHASEVLVSQTVKDLVAGSGLEFEDRGEHVLKGIPGAWRVFAATPKRGATPVQHSLTGAPEASQFR
jgi:class 3 adenylate cyclase